MEQNMPEYTKELTQRPTERIDFTPPSRNGTAITKMSA